MASTPQSAKFEVDLEGNYQANAKKDADETERLAKQIEEGTSALRGMQQAFKNLQGGSVVNIKQAQYLRESIDKQKQSIASAQGRFVALGGQMQKYGKAAKQSGKDGGEGFGVLKSELQSAGGILGGTTGKISHLTSVLGKGGLYGAVALVAVAIVALGVAAAAAALSLLKLGLSSADARRSELLHLEALTKMPNYFGIAAGKATDLQAAIDKVSGSSALSRGEVAEFAESLYKMGMRGRNLDVALEATSISASALGKSMGSAYSQMMMGAALTGQSVTGMANVIKARFGDIANKQALSLSVQLRKLRENASMLFSGLKIEGFLKAFNQITQMFSLNTIEGRALKTIIETLFQPIFGQSVTAEQAVKKFIQGAIIGALQLEIVFLKVRNRIREMMPERLKKAWDWTNVARVGVLAVGVALAGAAISAGALAVALGVIVVSVGLIMGAVALLAAAVLAPFYLIYRGVKIAVDAFKSVDWAALGMSIVQGIANGVTGAANWLKDAIVGLGGKALGWFKNALGIHSPSAVFKYQGRFIPMGMAEGIRSGTPDVRRATNEMVSIPRGESSSGSSVLNHLGGGTVHIDQLHVHGAGDKPADFAASVKQEIERILEGVSINMGAKIGA